MIFQELIDLDAAVDMTENVQFINDHPATTEKELNEILSKTTTSYDNRDGNDQISLLPKCQCGTIHFRDADKLGIVCPNCGTKAISQVDSLVQSTLWFKRPEGFEKLLNPLFYHMLQNRFTANGWNAIAWLTDSYYKCSNKVPPWMGHLQAQGYERGWNYFISHFDEIMTYLFGLTVFKVKKGEVDYLRYLMARDYNNLFCNYIPIPDRVMFPYERTNFCIYRSNSAGFASSIVQSMLSIDSPVQKLSQRSRERRMSCLYRNIVEYQHHHVKFGLSPKEGEIRRHNLGTKTILSGRAIIISKTGPQDHEYIGIPWFMALGAFYPVFINKLCRRGFSAMQAANHIRRHTAAYCPILRDIMGEMIEQGHEGNLWCLYDRNPSLKHGSMQLGSIYFKTDPSDKCIDFPIANVKSPNAKNELASCLVMDM